jgi:hypothetical protein
MKRAQFLLLAVILLPMLPIASAGYTDQYTFFEGFNIVTPKGPVLGNGIEQNATLVCWFNWDLNNTIYLDCLDRVASGTSLYLLGGGTSGVVLTDGSTRTWIIEYNGSGYMLGGDSISTVVGGKTRYIALSGKDMIRWYGTSSDSPEILTFFSTPPSPLAGFNYLCVGGSCYKDNGASILKKYIGYRSYLTQTGLSYYTGSSSFVCSLTLSKCYNVTSMVMITDPYPGGSVTFTDPVRLVDIVIGVFNNPVTPESYIFVVDATNDKLLGYYYVAGWAYADEIPLETPMPVIVYDNGGTTYIVKADTVDPTGLPGGLTYTSVETPVTPTGLPSISSTTETWSSGVFYYGVKSPDSLGLVIYTKWSGQQLTPPTTTVEGSSGQVGIAVPSYIFYLKPEQSFMYQGCVVNLWPVEFEGVVNGYQGATVEWRFVTWDSRKVWPSINKTDSGYNITWFNESGPPWDYIYRGWFTVLYVPYDIYNSTGGEYSQLLEECQGMCWENTVEFDGTSFTLIFNDTAVGGDAKKYAFYYTATLPKEPGWYVIVRVLRVWDMRYPIEHMYYCVDSSIGAIEIYANTTEQTNFLTRALLVVFRPLINAVKSLGASIVGAIASIMPEPLQQLFSALYNLVVGVLTSVIGKLGVIVDAFTQLIWLFPLILAGIALYDPVLILEFFRKIIGIISSILQALRSLLPI